MAQMKAYTIPMKKRPLFENGVTFVIDFQKVVCALSLLFTKNNFLSTKTYADLCIENF